MYSFSFATKAFFLYVRHEGFSFLYAASCWIMLYNCALKYLRANLLTWKKRQHNLSFCTLFRHLPFTIFSYFMFFLQKATFFFLLGYKVQNFCILIVKEVAWTWFMVKTFTRGIKNLTVTKTTCKRTRKRLKF